MSLTRPAVKEILSKAGISAENMDDAVKEIIAGHTATVDALKEKLDGAASNGETAEKLKAEVEKYKVKLADAEKTIAENASLKEQYEAQKAEYEKYKGDVEAKATQAAKESAVWDYLKDKGIPEKRKAAVMRGIKDEIAGAELTEKGKLKSTKVFDELVGEGGIYSDFVSRTEIVGANPQELPPNSGNVKMTKEEIMNIKDTTARQQKILENPELFNLPPMQ